MTTYLSKKIPLRHLALGVFCVLAFSGQAQAEDAVEKGKQCFEQMKALEAAFDPKSVEMVSDKAKIEFHYQQNGENKKMLIDSATYKKTAIAALPQLKEKGYKVHYSDIQIVPQGAGFLVTGKSGDGVTSISFSTLYSVDSGNQCHIDEMSITTNS